VQFAQPYIAGPPKAREMRNIGFAHFNAEKDMSTESSVYKVTEIIGTSPTSWEEAAKNALETAAGSLRDLRIAEVCKLDIKIENDKVVEYRARVSVSFKYES